MKGIPANFQWSGCGDEYTSSVIGRKDGNSLKTNKTFCCINTHCSTHPSSVGSPWTSPNIGRKSVLGLKTPGLPLAIHGDLISILPMSRCPAGLGVSGSFGQHETTAQMSA